MKLLVWACLVCLIGNGVSGLFFDELSQFFGGKTDEAAPNDGLKPVNSSAATTNGFLDEIEHAANRVDSLWQQFRKELLSLMNSSNGGDDVDGHNNKTTTSTVATTAGLLQLERNSNKMNAKLATTTMVTPTPQPPTTTIIDITPTTKLELPSSTPLP